jgi:hypothetical protein
MNEEAMHAARWLWLLGLVLVPLLMYAVRRLLLMHLQGQMLVDSGEQEAVTDAVLSGEVMTPAGTPRVAWYTTEDVMRQAAAAQAERERVAARLFKRVFLVDLTFSVVYAVLASPFGLILPFLVTVRWVAHRRRFRAADLSRSRERAARRRWLAWLWKGPVNLLLLWVGSPNSVDRAGESLKEASSPRWRVALILAAILPSSWKVLVALPVVWSDWRSVWLLWMEFPFALAIFFALHMAVMARQVRAANRIPGICLLVLRVFNDEASSSFTFSGLMKRWRHFGHHYTIVDGSLLEQARSSRKFREAFILLVSWGALALAWNLLFPVAKQFGDPLASTWAWALLLGLALFGAGIVLVLGRLRINGLFMRSRKDLLARLARMDKSPRHDDLSFRHMRAACHNNVWFLAVQEFAKRSQVVLMDLRSFTTERQGCRTEIEFLFNAVPAGRVLFLVSDSNAHAAVTAMQEIWWRQRASSPNRNEEDPVLHLFRCQVNDEYDMQAILQLLVQTADLHVATARATPATLDARAPIPAT